MRTLLSRLQNIAKWAGFRRNIFNSLQPASRSFGFDRGKPIDRHYIENFLRRHAGDIQGRVLEIGDDAYTRQFGGGRVSRTDVLHAIAGNPIATVIGSLETGEGVPADAFSCIVLTQTLPFIYEMRDAIAHCHRALSKGGVLLATVPGISQISRYDMDRWGDYWRFTSRSAQQLFSEVFGNENVAVETHGNVLVACSFLRGLATHELRREELDFNDPDYQVLITVRAVKTGPTA